MSSVRLLGAAIVCFTLGLVDLALLNLWGIPLAWPTLTKEGMVTAPFLWQPSESLAEPGASVRQTPDIVESEHGDNEGIVPESPNWVELKHSALETPSSDEPAAESLPVAPAYEGERTLEEVGESVFAESEQDAHTSVQVGGLPATAPVASQTTASENSLTGSDSEEPRRHNERDSQEDIAVQGRATVETESGNTQTAVKAADVAHLVLDNEDEATKLAPTYSPEPVTAPEKDGVVMFATDEHSLNPQAIATLEDIVAVLQQQPQLFVSVEGHTDRRGTVLYNQRLSERRANAVALFLKENGIAGERIKKEAFGLFKPIDPADNHRAWAKNRRVELRITKNSL